MTDRFADLHERYRRELLALAWRVLGDQAEAEDTVQETFVKLAGAPVLDRSDDDAIAWMRRVCLNDSFNRLRSRRRADERLQRVARLEPSHDGGDVSAASVLRAEVQAQVREALAALPERQRACLLLRHSGYRYAEIAATVGIAVGSVGVLLARAERAFRTAYREHDDEHLS